MLTDGRDVPTGTVLPTKVSVVGAGPAGIALAGSLAAAGHDVLVLESGGMDPDPDVQALSTGELVGMDYYPLDECRYRGFGGSAQAWDLDIGDSATGARVAPLDAIDFERRDWVPHSGWPFGRDHLDPYYVRANAELEIGKFSAEVEDWQDEDQTPPLPLNKDVLETTVFQFQSSRTYTTRRRREFEAHPRVTVVHHATAIHVDMAPDMSRVQSITCATLKGNTFKVTADMFVLAAGGIENARLLLASSDVAQAGVGNGYDLVGRFFMEHSHYVAGILVPADPGMLNVPAYSQIHLVNGTPVQRKVRLAEAAQRSEQLLGYGLRLEPAAWTANLRYKSLQPDQTARRDPRGARHAPAGSVGGRVGRRLWNAGTRFGLLMSTGLARARWEMERRTLRTPLDGHGKPALYQFKAMAEQVPNRDSRVTLSDRVDGLGMRLLDPSCRQARLDWRLSPMDKESMLRAQELIRREFSRAGIGRVRMLQPKHIVGGRHHMGTTRMNADAKRGVVDSDCRVHEVSNLYIAGSSVFPTGGWVNPTLTLVALAIRLADHLHSRLEARPHMGPHQA